MLNEILDVLIVGTGISGISAACHLRKFSPNKSFAMVEARQDIGGTWDLFKYPGIRSDTDMYSFGFSFKPWKRQEAYGSAKAIKSYLTEALKDNNLKEKIHFGLKVLRANWSSEHSLWHVELKDAQTSAVKTVKCRFLFMGTGYYNYEKGYMPEFPKVEAYEGTLIHAQHWDEDINYDNKRVVIIGSGATAVTLLPELSKKASHVTLLQRSPSYFVVRAGIDKQAQSLKKFLPLSVATTLLRVRNMLMQMYVMRLCKTKPEKAKALFIGGVRQALGNDYDVEKHFTPSYNPWEQRLCMVPDGDMFKAIKSGKAEMKTDQIECFTAKGIQLKSGELLEADVVVAATGLNLEILSNIEIFVDNKPFTLSNAVNFKGVTFCGLPNFALTSGYTKASWTLKADLTSRYLCRLINYMEKHNYKSSTPRMIDKGEPLEAWSEFSSGYIQRNMHKLPKQGRKAPWKFNGGVLPDLIQLRVKALNTKDIEFKR